MKSLTNNTRAYLGDGVYVEMEYGQVAIWTSTGVRESERVYLEPEVWDALVSWKSRQGHREQAND